MFSRYYDRGDFLSLRHYSRRQKYAVPYNGEEVYLHWANKDQYYIKTGECFTNYRWQDGSASQRVTVLFRLTEAVVEKDNIKAPETRYFLPQTDALAWDADSRTLTLPMHWRGLLAEEETRFGAKNGQDAILEAALADIEKHSLLKDNAELKAALLAPQTGPDGQPRVSDKGAPISRLRHHLRRYTRRNTSDFFIHRDLAGFLGRELDFYLKNEVLHLDDLEKGGTARADGWFQLVRTIRAIGTKIIAFLAQIEEFQKKLFEKKKFVTECHYAITLDRVPEELYREIAANTVQREEWVKLYAIDEVERDTTQPGYSAPLKLDFLKAHRFLMVDTRHFGQEFKDRLLAALPNLDEQTNGLVVNSENLQALRQFDQRYRDAVKCVYIDPPYNTKRDTFPYKDGYRRSTWISIVEPRLECVVSLMKPSAALFCSIDQNEHSTLRGIGRTIFSAENWIGEIAWKNATDNNPTRIAIEHEYIPCWARDINHVEGVWKTAFSQAKDSLLNFYKEQKGLGLNPDEIQRNLRSFIRDNKEIVGELDRYKHVDEDGIYTGSESVHNPHPGGYDYEILHPDTKRPMRKPANGYRFPWGTMKRDYIDKYRLIYGSDENRIVKIKLYLEEYQDSLRSVINLDGRLGAYAIRDLFGGTEDVFPNPKPPQLLERLFTLFGAEDPSPILDFFAGSGTTGEAIIEASRHGKFAARYILIDFSAYFDTVLVPRLKKVVYSKDWKDGKPLSRETGVSHCMKILRLESYEDALGNIGFGNEEQGQALMDLEGYKLSYLLDFETRESATFLNVVQLRSPFRYTLDIRDGEETRRQRVDLPETFSYLIGLIVERRTVHEHKAGKQSHHYLLYRGKTREADTPTAVLWREIEGWKEDDFQREKEWLASEKLLDGADRIYVNGTSAIEGAESLDPLFKRLLFAGTTAATT